MNQQEQRQVTEIDMEEFEKGYMDGRTPRFRLNHYIKCFPADNWVNEMVHRYNARNAVTMEKANLEVEDVKI